jgi:hypothetical protein
MRGPCCWSRRDRAPPFLQVALNAAANARLATPKPLLFVINARGAEEAGDLELEI